jgi:hypothetical protein
LDVGAPLTPDLAMLAAQGESTTLELKRSTCEHPSVQRNLIIAKVSHRAGLIEKWGRGTIRVVEMCRAASAKPPEFVEVVGAAVVTFRVRVAGRAASPQDSRPESQPESGVGSRVESGATSPLQVTDPGHP